jgi:hypothetical protein
MTHQPAHVSKTILIATLLTIGCTGSGMAGCGSESSSTNSPPTIDSDLLGIYAIDSFQSSPLDEMTGEPVPDSCDQLSDSPTAGDFVVLYAFRPNDDPENPRLGGVFCGSVEVCQDVIERAPEPAIGYSFINGSDESGWTGYGISATGSTGAMCQVDVQEHTLTAAGAAVTINTDVVEVEYEPEMAPDAGDEATCSVRRALESVTPDLPCKSRLRLIATRN